MVIHHAATRNTKATTNDIQLDVLLSCLEADKTFLDKMMEIPSSHTNQVPGWGIKVAQERVRVDLYLESLCYRMQSLTTYNRVSQPHPDFWLSIFMIMEKTRNWYVQKIRPASQTPGTSEESPLGTISDPHGSGSGRAG
ncbi:hypothetical protein GQ44DRAFT_769371 [Phaeosphaeriaceae sp. PMI808]|nr:hypothetical protein GQ44DRAFT_769371 [Phaeosphaeriaceae sp. PMI808]